MRMKKLAIITMALALTAGSAFTSLADWQQQEGGAWKFRNEDGTWKVNTWWQNGSGKWYSFDQNGIMRKGWFKDANQKWYFLTASGEMRTGLTVIDGKTYFFNPSGDMYLGEMTINGTSYNFTEYGSTTAQAYISDKWYGNGEKVIYATGSGGGSGSGGGGSNTPSTTTKEVATQEDLLKAINSSAKTIILKTDSSDVFTTPAVNKTGKTLVVNAPNASVVNETTFSKIEIKNIASQTFTEKSGTNSFEITAPNAHVIAETEITDLTVKGSGVGSFSLEAKAPVSVNIETAADVTLTGNQPVKASINAAGTNLSSEAPTDVVLNKSATVTLSGDDAVKGSNLTVKTNDKVTIQSDSTEKVKVSLETSEPTLSVGSPVETTVTAGVKKVNVEVTDSGASVSISEDSKTDNLDEIVVTNSTEDPNLEPDDFIKNEGGVDIPTPSKPDDKAVLEQIIGKIKTLVKDANANDLSDLVTASMNEAGTRITLVGKADKELTVIEAASDVVGLVQDFAKIGVTEVKIGDVMFSRDELLDESNNANIIIAVRDASGILGFTEVNEAKGQVTVTVYYNEEKQDIVVAISPK